MLGQVSEALDVLADLRWISPAKCKGISHIPCKQIQGLSARCLRHKVEGAEVV